MPGVLVGEVFVLQLSRLRTINIPAGCVWKLTGSFSKYAGIRRGHSSLWQRDRFAACSGWDAVQPLEAQDSTGGLQGRERTTSYMHEFTVWDVRA